MRPGCNICRPSFTCAACLIAPLPGQLTLRDAAQQVEDERDCDPGDCSDHLAVATR